MITFGSLFAGIGGFDLGFERAGMVCKWQVEIDNYATRVLEKHWPGVHRERDIRSCGKHNLERVDVICGGFPCQDISYAGLGAGLDGERSGLFYEAIRVVRELQPKVVVLENVAALLTRGLDRVLGTLASIGFDAEWHCIPAAYVGAPHIRDRIFIISYNTNREVFCPLQKVSGRQDTKSGRTCDENSDTDGSSIGRNARRENNVEDEWNITSSVCEFDVTNSNSEGLEKWQGKDSGGARAICGTEFGRSQWWESEPNVGRVAYGVSRRVDRLRGLGNAIVPQVAEWIGRQIVGALK
jgi:DNA (cytosine-5)-methyltransferase 1